MEEYRKIENLLEKIRKESSSGLVDQGVSEFLRLVDMVSGNLGEFGTSEEELKRLLKEGHASQAKSFLRIAREMRSQSYINVLVEIVRRHATKAEISLEEIGTSEEELKEIIGS